jgi:RNA polymerase sigma-70 factor (ECF subfamily)
VTTTTTIDGMLRPGREPGVAADAAAIRRSIDDPAAFDAVFERHHHVVFRYVASRVGPDVAEDVVGEVFLAAFASRSKFRPELSTSALPWLLGIATRRISRQRDAERRWVAQCQAAQGERGLQVDDEAESRIDAERLAPRLDVALQALPLREREPLLLHVLAGLSYEEVAAALDVKLGTVRSRISRGRSRLAGILDGARR